MMQPQIQQKQKKKKIFTIAHDATALHWQLVHVIKRESNSQKMSIRLELGLIKQRQSQNMNSSRANIIIAPIVLASHLHQGHSFGFGENQHPLLPCVRPPSARILLPSTTDKSIFLEGGEEPLPTLPITVPIINGDGSGDDKNVTISGNEEEPSSSEHHIKTNRAKFIPPIFDKTKDESSFIKSALMTNFMFQSLPDKTLDKLVMAFEKVEYNKNSIVTKQGDTNVEYFYVLYNGECSVTIDKKKLQEPYGTLSEGTLFGELSMLYNVPRCRTGM